MKANQYVIDWIASGTAVLASVPTRFYMDNALPHTTQVYQRVLEAVLRAEAQLLEPEARTITMGNAVLHIVPPTGIEAWGQNNNSIGVRLEYGEFSAFFPGDAEPLQWEWWLATYPTMFAPVMLHVASHHGSRNGDTPAGAAALQPQLVIISTGEDNQYGHPHPELLALYEAVPAFRTDVHGTVRVVADLDGSYVVYVDRN